MWLNTLSAQLLFDFFKQDWPREVSDVGQSKSRSLVNLAYAPIGKGNAAFLMNRNFYSLDGLELAG